MKGMRHTLIGLSTLTILYACTPTFKTTEQLCNAHVPTRQAVKSYEVSANNEDSEYKLYFEDFLNSLNNLQSKSVDEQGNTVLSELSADEIAVRDFILQKVQEEMNYNYDNEGKVASTTNPLDFLASIVSASDDTTVIDSFVLAKQQMASAIETDDGHCVYRNDQIEYIREDDSFNVLDLFKATFALSYIPSSLADANNDVDQTIVTVFDDQPESDENTTITYAGADRIAPVDFKSSGYSKPQTRQINLTKISPPQILFLNEDYADTKTGTFSFSVANETCTDGTDENNTVKCADGAITKPVEHARCIDGIDNDGDDDNINSQLDEADEADTVLAHSYTIGDGSNSALTNIKRLKVEVDYPNNEVRVYTTKFNEAIYKALDEQGNPIAQGDDNPNPTSDQLILDPTRCEAYNVSKDLTGLNDDVSTEATPYLDPNYEYIEILDDNGDPVLDEDGFVVTTTPTPVFIFEGTDFPER